MQKASRAQRVERSDTDPEPQTVVTTCRICVASCGVIVQRQGDQIIRVSGDPNHPLTHGYTCPKGRAAPELHHHPDRIDYPQLRGDSGTHHRTTWRAALDRAAGSIRDLVARYGSDSVGLYIGTGWASDFGGKAVVDAFIRGLGSTQLYTATSVDAPSKFYVPVLMFGADVLPFPDMPSTDLCLVLGQNPVVSHGHGNGIGSPAVSIREVQRRGGSVVVFDPRESESAQLADLHLSVRPGSDAAALGYLVRAILRSRVDTKYVASSCDLDSVERLRDAVEPFTLERAAAICDVPPHLLARVGTLVLTHSRIGVATGTGLSMAPGANVSLWLAFAIAVLTGSLDRSGGTICASGVVAPLDVFGVKPRSNVFPHLNRGRPELPAVIGADMPPAVALADEILDGYLKALIVVGANPVLALPNTPKVRAALEALDLCVLVDIVGNETLPYADVILPMTGQFERPDVSSRNKVAVTFAQYCPPVVPPAGERRSLASIFAELGDRLGLKILNDEEAHNRLAARPLDDNALLEYLWRHSRLPWVHLKEANGCVVDANAPSPGWFVPDCLPRPIDLAPVPLVDQLAGWLNGPPSADELLLVTRRQASRVNGLQCAPVRAQRDSQPTLQINPVDAERLGVADGAGVQIRSQHGACPTVAQITSRVRPGTVSLPQGWASTNVNTLTSDREGVDPLTGMPWYTAFPVTVQPISELDG